MPQFRNHTKRTIATDIATHLEIVVTIFALTIFAAGDLTGPRAALAFAPPPSASGASGAAGPLLAREDASVPGEVIIQLKAPSAASASYRRELAREGRTGLGDLDTRLAAIGAARVEPAFEAILAGGDPAAIAEAGLDRILVVRYGSSSRPEEAARALAGARDLVFAEPNYIARASLTPNDPTYVSQWAHNNTGQAIKYSGGSCGTPDCDTDTPEAWDLETGSASLVLAIIDTGVDTGHPEFAGRVVAGYDYVNGDGTPADDNGHGTACAGIALGAGNNALGISGVAWGVKLMPVKVLDAAGNGAYSAVANGITYAANNGAKILSLSLGGPASSTLQAAVDYAVETKGCALFCATGNANTSSLDYPAAYANTIAVGALSPCSQRKSTTSCDGESWWGSNYAAGIDFLAPGVRIHTTDIRGSAGLGTGDYVTDFNGTSAATPHAAGIGALVWSENPALTNAALRTTLQSNCDDMSTSGYDPQTGYGRLNALRAVQNAGGDSGGGSSPVAIFSETFEVTTVPGSGWSAADVTGLYGYDYWGEQSSASGARVHGGSWSAYCADNSTMPGQRYDSFMSADLTLASAVDVSDYTDVQLSFWKWHATYNSSDYLALQYWDGSAWVEMQRWSGASSVWTNANYSLSGFSTFRFRFLFVTNYVNTTEGAYIDDIVITGIPESAGKRTSEGIATVSFVSEQTEDGIAIAPQPNGGAAHAKDDLADAAASAPPAVPSLTISPNPSRDATSLRFALRVAAPVSLELFSVDGRRVARLVEERLTSGEHAITWSGRDESGRSVSAGVYFARLIIGGKSSVVERVILLR